MSFVYTNAIKITKHKDYGIKPGLTHDNVICLHCIKSNMNPITLKLLSGEQVTFPPHSFVAGALYPYAIKSLLEGDEDIFLGLIAGK